MSKHVDSSCYESLKTKYKSQNANTPFFGRLRSIGFFQPFTPYSPGLEISRSKSETQSSSINVRN